MSGRFAGKIALVTGAASGIGAAFARQAAEEGAAGLALLDRNGDALAALVADLSCPAHFMAGDVSDQDTWARFEADVAERFGGIDLALANAGIGHSMRPIADLDPGDFTRAVSVNLIGAFLTLRTGLRLMREGGAIVLVASSMALKPSPGTAGYGASKAALLQLTKIAALEAAPRGIRVNAISPGGVETPLFRGQDFFEGLIAQTGSERGAFDALAARTPLGRYASAEETARLIAFLMSGEAAQITGANLVADAGMTL